MVLSDEQKVRVLSDEQKVAFYERRFLTQYSRHGRTNIVNVLMPFVQSTQKI